MTAGGVILGTAAYMSPEQARGNPVDRRADMWAFGCVLYEMLTGRKAFEAAGVTDTLAAVLRAEPEWQLLPPDTPEPVRRLLRRALEKNAHDRLSDMAAARLELRDAADKARPTVSGRIGASARERIAWSTAVLAIAVMSAGGVWLYGRHAQPTYQASIVAPAGATYGSTIATPASFMALSPDGRRLAFVATGADRRAMLWIRELDSASARVLPGTEGAREPFWSFDSRSVAFIADAKLKRVDVSAGSIQMITEPAAQGGAWNQDNVILFAPTNQSPIYRVPAAGGPAVAVTALDARKAERTHDYPVFLPDGNHFLYLSVGSSTGLNETNGVFLASLDNPTAVKQLPDIASTMQYSNGHLLYLRDSTLVARPFDVRRMEWRGDAAPIAENIAAGGSTGRGGAFSASLGDVLVFQGGSSGPQSQLRWFDRDGKPIGTVGLPGEYQDPALSPDQRYAVATMLDAQRRNYDIAIFDLARGIPQKVTTSSADEIRPIWSPDGQYIAFGRRTNAGLAMYRKRADGTGPEELLLEGASPLDWSPDGRHILFVGRAGPTDTFADLWVLSLDDRKSRVYLPTPYVETTGAFSPNGRWVAYTSNELGSFDVYVSAFPQPAARVRVSSNGGVAVRWRRDGRELVYGEPDGTAVAVTVDGSGPTFLVKQSQRLFQLRVRPVGRPGDVALTVSGSW